MHGHEGVGFTGWCPVSQLWHRAWSLVSRHRHTCARPSLLPWQSPPHTPCRESLAVVCAVSLRRGPPWPSPTPAQGFCGNHPTAISGMGLRASLPDPLSPCPALATLLCFRARSSGRGACFPLPFAVYSGFLGTEVSDSHVALATEQLLCPQPPAS